MDYTDEQLVMRHLAMRAHIDALTAAYKAEVAQWNGYMETIENEMGRRLNARGANSSPTDAGTFYKQTGTSTRVVDKMAFLEHVFQQRLNNMPNCYDMLTQAVSKDSVLAYMKENGEHPPPGVEVTKYTNINVRKG